MRVLAGLLLLCILGAFISNVAGDLYLHNPRGSNNRLGGPTEPNNNRNANRLFDSQNNGQGGYCWGPPMNFYTGSILSIEWTNQHACGNDEAACNLVLQYMCSDDNGDETKVVRDGTTRDAPNADTYLNKDANTGVYTAGMHEPYDYYQACTQRSRNKGLFLADQQIGERATNTRQNNGARYGFECAEEKDYYPYWHPTPWKDIAVLVDDKKQCSYFQKESQNVVPKYYCKGDVAAQKTANNKQECLAANGAWESQPAWDIPKPDCLEAPWNRDNHLGNAVNGYANNYNWTLPSKEPCLSGSCSCVLRVRYNISNAEINNWENFDDSTKNGANSPVKDDPYVMIGDKNVSIALDTSQYGRTFQDRSHIFKLIPRPKDVPQSAKIYNLNVRGRRGNIVQTFPAVEYDFAPKELTAKVGDYVHFQWTGCDHNTANVAGEGRDQTDRSNIVQIASYGHQMPLKEEQLGTGKGKITPMFEDAALRYKFAHIDQTNCLSYDDLKTKHGNNQNAMDQDIQNCMKLNGNPDGYFNGGLIKMKNTGNFYYMSSRNNNFSNRTQKALLIVEPLIPAYGIALIVIGGVLVGTAGAAVGSVVYAKKHPHSKCAEYVSKVPLLNRV